MLTDSLTFIDLQTSRGVQLEEPASAPKLDPIQELSEEEKGKTGSQSYTAGRLHAVCMDASVCWRSKLVVCDIHWRLLRISDQ